VPEPTLKEVVFLKKRLYHDFKAIVNDEWDSCRTTLANSKAFLDKICDGDGKMINYDELANC